MKCITVQHESVLDILNKNGIYRASEDNVCDIMVKPYNYMKKHFNWKSMPIFLSPIGYYCNMGGAKFNSEAIALEFDIPDELVKVQNYYNWSDFIYFCDMPYEFKEAFNVDKFKDVWEWAPTIMNNKLIKSKLDIMQVSVEYLQKDWITGFITDLSKLEYEQNDTGGKYVLQNLAYYT